MIQFLVNHGYAVYAINNRGLKGYGRTFRGATYSRRWLQKEVSFSPGLLTTRRKIDGSVERACPDQLP